MMLLIVNLVSDFDTENCTINYTEEYLLKQKGGRQFRRPVSLQLLLRLVYYLLPYYSPFPRIKRKVLLLKLL